MKKSSHIIVFFIFWGLINSCKNEDSLSASEKQERIKMSMAKLAEESQKRKAFFREGGVDMLRRNFTSTFKTIEEAESFYNSFVKQNQESPYLKEYKSLFSNILITNYDLATAKTVVKKQQFIKYFNILVDGSNGNYSEQATILEKSKPYLTPQQYEKFVVEVRDTKQENKATIERQISFMEKALKKEEDAEKVRQIKGLLKMYRKALAELDKG